MPTILDVIEDQTKTGTGAYPGAYTDGWTFPEWIHGPYTVGGNNVSITHVPDKLVFPLKFVTHLDPSGNSITVPGVDAMENLPPPSAAPHVVHMQEDSRDQRSFTLTVYSHDEGYDFDGNLVITNYVTSFTARIIANYTTNKNLLEAAVAARR